MMLKLGDARLLRAAQDVRLKAVKAPVCGSARGGGTGR